MTDEKTTPQGLRHEVTSLLDATRTALERDHRAADLAADLPNLSDAPLKIALAGPTNAGKSMLIAALLKFPQDLVDEITSAKPETSKITPYDWLGNVLLDLPGTQSGLDAHEREAAAGVRKADLLVLVTSVELPGEHETSQINHLLGNEGFSRRVLVVLNKCNSEDNDPKVIREEMLGRLASFPWIEPIFADAKEYLVSRNDSNVSQEDRDLLRSESHIEDVEAALSALVLRKGHTARLLGFCHEARRTAVEASALWDADEAEESQEVAARRIQDALDQARADLDAETGNALDTLTSSIREIGTVLAASVSEKDGSLSDNDVVKADADEVNAVSVYEEAIDRVVRDAMSRLDLELDGTLEDFDRYIVEAERVAVDLDRGRVDQNKGKLDGLAEQALEVGTRKVKKKFGAIVDGGFREGDPAHDLAKRLHASKLAKKLKLVKDEPAKAYTHQNNAKGIQKVGKAGKTIGDFLNPVLDAKGIFDNIVLGDAVKKKREQIRKQFDTRAQTMRRNENARIDGHLETVLGVRRAVVADMLEAVNQAVDARARAQHQWQSVADRAAELADLVELALAT